jgi:hypothetical protein
MLPSPLVHTHTHTTQERVDDHDQEIEETEKEAGGECRVILILNLFCVSVFNVRLMFIISFPTSMVLVLPPPHTHLFVWRSSKALIDQGVTAEVPRQSADARRSLPTSATHLQTWLLCCLLLVVPLCPLPA